MFEMGSRGKERIRTRATNLGLARNDAHHLQMVVAVAAEQNEDMAMRSS